MDRILEPYDVAVQVADDLDERLSREGLLACPDLWTEVGEIQPLIDGYTEVVETEPPPGVSGRWAERRGIPYGPAWAVLTVRTLWKMGWKTPDVDLVLAEMVDSVRIRSLMVEALLTGTVPTVAPKVLRGTV